VTDRTTNLEVALRVEDALIVQAQRLLTDYLTKDVGAEELITNLLHLFDGPRQREAKRLVREALGEDSGDDV
jgi:hypothetical protein